MMAGGERGGEGAGGAGMRRWRRRRQTGTVAGGWIGKLLWVALWETRIGATHGHRRRSGAPAGHVRWHVDALSPHHHGTLLVHVLLVLLLPLAQVVAEVLALTLGQHLGVEGSLRDQTQEGETHIRRNRLQTKWSVSRVNSTAVVPGLVH